MPPRKEDKKIGNGKDNPLQEAVNPEAETTLDDIKTLLLSQERTFEQNFKSHDDRIKTSISQLKDNLHKEIDPLVEKQRQTDKEMVSMKEQIHQNSKETSHDPHTTVYSVLSNSFRELHTELCCHA